MRNASLILGILIIAIGFAGKQMLPERNQSFSFLQGGLSLGGAFVICYFFARNNYWHGMIGSGVVALLGFCRSMVNAPQWFEWLNHPSPKPPATPLLEMAVAAMCLWYLNKIVRLLLNERNRRLREEIDKPEDNQ
jgi:hypothetical protein